MHMGTKNDQEQRAIFLAAICGQTYAQFSNKEGSFVVPLDYQIVDTIEARSISEVWERFDLFWNLHKRLSLPSEEPAPQPIGCQTLWPHKRDSITLKKIPLPTAVSRISTHQRAMGLSLHSLSYLPIRPYTLLVTVLAEHSPLYVLLILRPTPRTSHLFCTPMVHHV